MYIRNLIFISLIVLTAAACSSHLLPLDQYHTHKVSHEGENLSTISKWYTGSAGNWRTIKKHNRKLNPKNMQIGTRILIPKTMVKAKGPLPAYYVKTNKKQPESRYYWKPNGEKSLLLDANYGDGGTYDEVEEDNPDAY